MHNPPPSLKTWAYTHCVHTHCVRTYSFYMSYRRFYQNWYFLVSVTFTTQMLRLVQSWNMRKCLNMLFQSTLQAFPTWFRHLVSCWPAEVFVGGKMHQHPWAKTPSSNNDTASESYRRNWVYKGEYRVWVQEENVSVLETWLEWHELKKVIMKMYGNTTGMSLKPDYWHFFKPLAVAAGRLAY